MKSLKNLIKNRRGAAIELAIFALALVAIFGTLLVSVSLSEAKYIKEDISALEEFTEQLKSDEYAKRQLKMQMYAITNGVPYIPGTTFNPDGYDIGYNLDNDKNPTKLTITSWSKVENE
ncbi:MAG: hypothetical protein IJW03_05880 [Clostridia bacterium]|nr:hypothetical protein [Clostridia bacterium]